MQTATSQPHPSVVAWGFMAFAQRKWVSGWARATSALFQEYPHYKGSTRPMLHTHRVALNLTYRLNLSF